MSGPWNTSYKTGGNPTAFDRFLDDASDALIADGEGTGRRDGIKQFVHDRRNYILTQVPAIEFEITVNDAKAAVTTEDSIILQGVGPANIASLDINGQGFPIVSTGKYSFEVEVSLVLGGNSFVIQGLDSGGNPVADAKDLIMVVRLAQ